MVLNRIDGELSMSQTLQGPVIEIDVGDLDKALVEGILIYTESVILSCDTDPFGPEIFDRMVGPSVTEFEFEGAPSQGETQDLMTQADTIDRFLADKLFDGVNDIRHSLGIPWTI